ncbi:MAG: leucine--tRNA ligase [Defluviitaleaceae bacterium]|nr:leucine--tRNA ligase [Defluviitaleaceae bacterium]
MDANTRFNFSAIDKKWMKRFADEPVNVYSDGKPSLYYLAMFPYPSGTGLHVGHWRPYVINDIMCRHQMLKGNYVMQPMGWDAFGLPAENYAIQTGVHPAKTTAESIVTFKKQLDDIGAALDWSREINTSDPAYYKWTQWIFIQMFKKGLAYEKDMLLNWCPSCKVVLANEESVGGCCERCGETATKKHLRQWMLRITAYAERLLNDLDGLDWSYKVKKMQTDWIGKSYGAEITFDVKGTDKEITVFTTRPDTLFGATFMVLSPEHELALQVSDPIHYEAVKQYINETSAKSNIDRMAAKDKTGVFTGAYAVNPVTGEDMPIWVADYVLIDYGTGAIMAVPAHDERDFEFASKYGLVIRRVIARDEDDTGIMEAAYAGEGVMVNSGFINGQKSKDAIESVANHLEKEGLGKKTVNYKLRDWVFSRQRYWGEPIPLIHCPICGVVPVPDAQLPVELPYVESYKPSDTGESPLSRIEEWVNTPCPQCGAASKRETNTMPNWAGSSWYYLRFADPHNSEAPISPEAMKKWVPVDLYIGGVEHAVLHLLYVRFYTKFLYDIGVVDFEEPFKRFFCNGMINLNGSKMSKSKGNYISPDDIIACYGRDVPRLYILFVGPPEMDSEWDENGIEGVFRFMGKAWKLVSENAGKTAKPTKELLFARNKLIKDVTERLAAFSFNTVVSAFMEGVNKLLDLSKSSGVDKETLETLIILLAPFAPFTSAEMWEITGHSTPLFAQKWPVCDESALRVDEITIVIQINGKVRENISVPAGSDKEEIIKAARTAAKPKFPQEQPLKEIYVPNKLVNFVF